MQVADATIEDVVAVDESATLADATAAMVLDPVGILTISDVTDHLPEKVREIRSTVVRRDEWT